MEDLNFEGALPNEILEDLIVLTHYAAKQYRAAVEVLPQAMMIKAFTGDAQAKLFFEAGSQHLLNLAASAGSLKTAPAVELPPLGMLSGFSIPSNNEETVQGGGGGE